MTRVIVNDELRGMLHDLKIPLELCNERGEILCRVTPVSKAELYENPEPPSSPEEIERRLKDKSVTYTTKEVLDYLRSH